MVVGASWLKDHVRDVRDFPRPGMVFKDITPLFAHAEAFRFAVAAISDHFAGRGLDKVVGIDGRGFVVAGPVAYRLGAGFVPVHKAGTLPWRVEKAEYRYVRGSGLLEIHRDALRPGDRVVIVDDVVATGGTASAGIRLVERLGGEVVGLGFVVELAFLGGRAGLGGRDAVSLITYE